jgi:hypothetical protein
MAGEKLMFWEIKTGEMSGGLVGQIWNRICEEIFLSFFWFCISKFTM